MIDRTPSDIGETGRLYRSLDDLHLVDRRRIGSRDYDLGRGWRVGLHGPTYRAVWARDSGKLYVVRNDSARDDGGEVQVLGICHDVSELEQVLGGWRDVRHQPDSINWLRHRAASLMEPETRWVLSPELPDATPIERGAAALRRHVDSKLLLIVGATAGITAPATALLLELAAA